MKEIEPKTAAEMLEDRQDIAFVDVRSRQEFVAGHPRGTVNIPLLEPDAWGRMAPNPDFLDTVRARVSADVPVILTCRSGARSRRAAEILEQAGYREVYNMDGGFAGRFDPGGRPVVPGWEASGLPVEYGEEGEKP